MTTTPPPPARSGWLPADVPAPAPAVDEDARLFQRPPERGGLITRIVIEGLLIFVYMVIQGAFASPPSVLDPLFLVVLLFLASDLAVLARPKSPIALGAEGHLKAVGWGMGSMAIVTVLAYGDLDAGPEPWVLGVGLALAGLSLYAHHHKVESIARKLMIEEGTLGAFVAAVGIPIGVSGALDAPASVIVGGSLLALGLVIAVTVTRRLLHKKTTAKPARSDIGWYAWFQENFFRHMLILAAVVAYLFLRDPLRGLIGPFFVPVEYGLGVALLGSVFWSLRSYLKRRLAEHPLASPHRRHEETITRQGEPGYDHLDQTMAAFLDRGDIHPLQTLGESMDRRGIPASRHLAPILSYVGPTHTTLIHPAWLYGARIAVLFLVALALGMFLGDLGDSTPDPSAFDKAGWAFFSLVLGLGLFLSQWNRFGGPFWARTTLGYSGVLFLFLADSGMGAITGAGGSFVGSFGPAYVSVLVWLGLLVAPLHHIVRRDKDLRPYYAVSQRDPVATIERLRRDTERQMMKRLVWLGVIGVIFFLIVGQITAQTGAPLGFLFNTYLVVALAFLVHPMLLVAGLRLGKEHVERQDRTERARRKARYDTATADLFRLFADMRYPPRPEDLPQTRDAPRLGPDGRPTPYDMAPPPPQRPEQ